MDLKVLLLDEERAGAEVVLDEIGLRGFEGVDGALLDGGEDVGPNGFDGSAKEQGKLAEPSGASCEV